MWCFGAVELSNLLNSSVVQDPCGVAGGTPQASFNAAEYTTTKYAKQGDYGTVVLKPRPTGTVWKRGTNASVRFQLTANHGGGCTNGFPPAV
eukprot:SAG31_NODE_574_length_13967_cov_7.512042_11_plen_92_part_00